MSFAKRINGTDQINLTTAGDQQDPILVKLDGGAGVAFYASAGGIRARALDGSGEPTGPETTVIGSGFNMAHDFSAIRLTNGNIVVAYADGAGDVIAKFYSPSLALLSSRMILDQVGSSKYGSVQLAATSTGFAAVADTTRRNGDIDVQVSTFTDSGAPLRKAFYASSALEFSPSVAVLANGNIVVSYNLTKTDFSDSDARIAILGPDPSNADALIPVKPSANVFDSPQSFVESLLVMPDGGYVLNGYSGAYSSTFTPVTGFYRADGTSITSFSDADPELGASVNSLGYVAAFKGNTFPYVEVYLPGGKTHEFTIASDVDPDFDVSVYWVNNYTIQLAYTLGGANSDGSGRSVATSRHALVAQEWGDDERNDTLIGSELIDVIEGYGGNDTLDGAGGPDTMKGGAGNDSYTVQEAGDLVDEQAEGSDGYDTVYSWITYTLPTNVEALVLLGAANINGTGNAADNFLQGNGGNNVLDGSYGKDNMRGLGGNDSYIVDNKGDVVNEIEPGSGGWDTVYSSINFTLPANVEALVLLGDLKLDGTGNGLANLITGNVAANGLKGGGGNDTIKGGLGKDQIDGGNGSDTADYSDKLKPVSVTLDGSHTVTVKIKGKAEDTLKNVENLIGGSKADTFVGDGKANSFDGGLGKDVFAGKGGNDKFVFSTALGPTNADTITDFSHKHDKIVLEDYLVSWFLGGAVERAEFYAKAGATKAHDTDDRLIYNTSNGNLYYDYDGKDGAAAVLFAKIDNHPGDFNHQDFLIV